MRSICKKKCWLWSKVCVCILYYILLFYFLCMSRDWRLDFAGKDPELAQQQRELAATIAYQLAQHFSLRRHDAERAQAFYGEALRFNEAHDASLLAMAKLQTQAGEVDQALQTAQMLLVWDFCFSPWQRSSIIAFSNIFV
jgi:hypothetical protein